MSASRIVGAWLFVVAYMALIWALSSVELPELALARLRGFDKVLHGVEYAGLGACVARAAGRTWPDRARVRLAAVAILIATAWGVLDEIHQALVPGRSSDVLDIVADFCGASAGSAGWFWRPRSNGDMAGAQGRAA